MFPSPLPRMSPASRHQQMKMSQIRNHTAYLTQEYTERRVEARRRRRRRTQKRKRRRRTRRGLKMWFRSKWVEVHEKALLFPCVFSCFFPPVKISFYFCILLNFVLQGRRCFWKKDGTCVFMCFLLFPPHPPLSCSIPPFIHHA